MLIEENSTDQMGVNVELCSTTRCVAFADIVGFSALMGEDESSAFRRWARVRDEIMVPEIERMEGIFIKSTGDGLLATFNTSNDAIDWAIAVQHASRNCGAGLRFRISLNWGNVIIDGDDIIGDCVNIAARLESFAAPGGIVLSKAVRNALEDHTQYDLQPMGDLRLHNIRRPVTAFQLFADARVAAVLSPKPTKLPALVILPFDVSEKDRLTAKALVHDITASLTAMRELTVTARSSAQAVAASTEFDPIIVGEALRVDYIVSGALQSNANGLRAMIDLTDTKTAEVIATEIVQVDIEAVFLAHDEIVRRIVGRVAPTVRWAELQKALSKPPENKNAHDLLLQALDLIVRFDPSAFLQARKHLDAAINADPNYAKALAWSARWRSLRVGQGWSNNPEEDFQLAIADARAAMHLDRGNALALATFGHIQTYMGGDLETAISYLDRAVGAGPNDPIARSLRSLTLSFLGRSTEAREDAERALRLSPFDEQLYHFYGFMALACYADDDFEAALRWARRGLAENPNYTHTLKVLIVSLVALEDVVAAKSAAQSLLLLEPGFTTDRYRRKRPAFADPRRVNDLIARYNVAGLE